MTKKAVKSAPRKVPKPAEIAIHGQAAKKGERMTPGTGWQLAATKGSKRVFKGTLIDTVNAGNQRLAIFKVPK